MIIWSNTFFRTIIQMSYLPQDQRVRCSLDQPLQRLMEKLSSKSPELYIFWQNYNQLYSLYSQKLIEIQTLRSQISHLRVQPVRNPEQIQHFKSREEKLERQFDDLKLENQKLRRKLSEAELTNHHLSEQNVSFEALLKRFQDENRIQKQNIDIILLKLQESESTNRVSGESKHMVEEQLVELKRSQHLASDLKRQLADKDSQIMLLSAAIEDYKREFERILVEAVRNCKIRLCESLPDIVQASKVTNIQKTVTTTVGSV